MSGTIGVVLFLLLFGVLHPTWGATSPSLTLTTALPVVGAGMPVDVVVTLTNNDPTDLQVSTPIGRNTQAELIYHVMVSDADGNPIPKTAFGVQLDKIYSVSWGLDRNVPQGHSVVDHFIASNNFDMTKKGVYHIQLSWGLRNVPIAISNVLTVTVAGGSRGDLNGDGIVDLKDLAIIQNALNTGANRDPISRNSDDARDLNQDGVIDVLDARLLTTLCTHPRCASQ